MTNKYLILNCLETALTEAIIQGTQLRYINELEMAIARLEKELGIVKSVVDYDYPERERVAA